MNMACTPIPRLARIRPFSYGAVATTTPHCHTNTLSSAARSEEPFDIAQAQAEALVCYTG